MYLASNFSLYLYCYGEIIHQNKKWWKYDNTILKYVIIASYFLTNEEKLDILAKWFSHSVHHLKGADVIYKVCWYVSQCSTLFLTEILNISFYFSSNQPCIALMDYQWRIDLIFGNCYQNISLALAAISPIGWISLLSILSIKSCIISV